MFQDPEWDSTQLEGGNGTWALGYVITITTLFEVFAILKNLL